MKHKFHAFTLLELVVVMAITGLIITIGTYIYWITQEQFAQFREEHNAIAEQAKVHHALSHDMQQAQYIYKQGSGLEMIMASGEVVNYQFAPQQLSRNRLTRTHIFPMEIKQVQFKFEHRPQTINGGLVDQVQFFTTLDKQSQPFLFHKNYSAVTLMKSEAPFF